MRLEEGFRTTEKVIREYGPYVATAVVAGLAINRLRIQRSEKRAERIKKARYDLGEAIYYLGVDNSTENITDTLDTLDYLARAEGKITISPKEPRLQSYVLKGENPVLMPDGEYNLEVITWGSHVSLTGAIVGTGDRTFEITRNNAGINMYFYDSGERLVVYGTGSKLDRRSVAQWTHRAAGGLLNGLPPLGNQVRPIQ